MENISKNRDSFVLNGESSYPVYYEDTDFSGFVYHANYLKFFERAREDLLGIKRLRQLWEENVHFVVARADIRFLAPARHGDTIVVKSSVELSESPVCQFIQQAYVGETRVCHATLRLACLGPSQRPERLSNKHLEWFRDAR